MHYAYFTNAFSISRALLYRAHLNNFKHLLERENRMYFVGVPMKVWGGVEGRRKNTSRSLCVKLLHSLRALCDCMLSELVRKNEAYSRLDFARRKSRPFIGLRKLRRLLRDLVEAVHHKWVHDEHRLFAEPNFWMHLLQHAKNVRLEGRRLLLRARLRCFSLCRHSEKNGLTRYRMKKYTNHLYKTILFSSSFKTNSYVVHNICKIEVFKLTVPVTAWQHQRAVRRLIWYNRTDLWCNLQVS